MRRFFVEAIDPEADHVIVKGKEARHIISVLRMGRGDRLRLMDGEGHHYIAVILEAGHGGVKARIETKIAPPPPPPTKTILCQALLKGDHFEYVIQKTSELGASIIIPFFSERTVVRINEKALESKMRRWAEIAKESAKQSGRESPLRLESPVDFKTMISRLAQSPCVRLMLWEDEGRCDIRGFLKEIESMRVITAVVGPEGGFSEKEVQSAREAGFSSVSLGERILRADTAAVALTAILQYEMGCLSRSMPLTVRHH